MNEYYLTLISYVGGRFGEFMTKIITDNNNDYYKPKIEKLPRNRYQIENYFYPLDVKSEWGMKVSKDIIIEKFKYYNKSLCLPTHWYASKPSFYGIKLKPIRFYCDDDRVNDYVYFLLWLKTLSIPTTANINQREDILSLIYKRPKHKKTLLSLMEPDRFYGWKYYSILNNWLNCDELDVSYFIERHLSSHRRRNYEKRYGWYHFDVGELVHGDGKNIKEFEKYFNISVNMTELKEYDRLNINLLRDQLGLTPYNLKYNVLVDYIMSL